VISDYRAVAVTVYVQTSAPLAARTPFPSQKREENSPNRSHFCSLRVQMSDEPAVDEVVARYQTKKLRSWRNGYARIFSLHHEYFSTFDPENFSETNR
jgi:hypothetical protein